MISRGQLGQRTLDPGQADNKEEKKMKIDDEVTFFEADLDGIKYPHDDPIVVSLNITNYDIHRILVDNESSVDVIFYDAFVCMNLNSELLMKKITPLIGFSGTTVPVEGIISLTMIARRVPKQTII